MKNKIFKEMINIKLRILLIKNKDGKKKLLNKLIKFKIKIYQ